MARLTVGVAIAAGALAAYWGLLFVGQRVLLYPAPPRWGAPPRPADAEPVWLSASDARIEAWYLPPTGGVGLAGPAPLLLFAHGNGELIDYWPGEFDEPREWGLGVLLVEYPGYGRSAGRASEPTIAAGMLAAYDWAAAEPRIDRARIIAYGRSLGGGATCALIGARPLAGLILESAFTSVRAFARGFGAPGFLVRDPFDNLARLQRYQGPLLVIHGENDREIPVRHGKALAAAVPAAELRLLPCGHNDCPRQWSLIKTFLARHRLLPAMEASP